MGMVRVMRGGGKPETEAQIHHRDTEDMKKTGGIQKKGFRTEVTESTENGILSPSSANLCVLCG